MKAKFIASDKTENIKDGKFLYLPVILSCQFENLGQFNIVIMRPDGVGSGFYGGWAKPEKNTLNRSWTLPIHEKELAGSWQVIVVLRTKDGSVDHLSLEGELTDDIKPISQKTVETVPFQIKFPTKDITVPYPTLWIAGKGSDPFDLTIKDKGYHIIPDESNNFLIPIELDFGSYSLIDIEGGSGTPGFRSSYSIFSIKGSFDSQITNPFPISLEKSITVSRAEKTIALEISLHLLENRTTDNHVVIEGKTSGKALISINGHEIQTKKGKFTEDVKLKNGENEIAITATLNELTYEERVMVTKITDKPFFVWEFPVEDLISAKKFQLIKGFADLESEIIIDGQTVPLTPFDKYPGIGKFEYSYPIRIGINEIEIVVQNKSGTIRESRFVECDFGKLSFRTVKRSAKITQIFEKTFPIRAQVTPGSSVIINDKQIIPSIHGEIDTQIGIETLGVNSIKIQIEKKEVLSDEYPPIRNGSQLLSDTKFLNDRQKYYLQSRNILSVKNFFSYKNFPNDFQEGLIESDLIYQLQKYLGFLLLSKNNLALFGNEEAFLLSLTEIRSIEELVGFDPVELITIMNNLAEKNNFNSRFVIGDANRWQRTLDDLLFEFQEEYLS